MQNPLFQKPVDLGISRDKKEISYEEAKNIMLDYLKTYLVKSYLLLNTNAPVSFAATTTEEPLDSREKSNNRIIV